MPAAVGTRVSGLGASSSSHTSRVGTHGLWTQLLEPGGSLCHPVERVEVSAPATGVGMVSVPKTSYWVSGAGMSEECEGLSTGSWSKTMDHSLCASCWRGDECLYLPQIMCMGE